MAGNPCPSCGAPLDAGAMADGLCARCLVAQLVDIPSSHEAPAEVEADRFGAYQPIRKLGEGGMGVVYLAKQTGSLRRQVALKVLKPGMDSRSVIARFEAERRTLALMEHPNIARIFDAGASLLGRPYFAMEYVEGVPITEYCDDLRFTTGERLLLFADACAAVEHAHSRGILHRDLKPSNVLVGDLEGKPRVRIIDFGIATAIGQRLEERTFFTEMGQLVGTPEYMSPEQADPSLATLDQRTDVYSLGVVLYELLVGTLPFEPARLRQAGLAETLRIIREDEPTGPAARLTAVGGLAAEAARKRQTDVQGLRQQLRGDLDRIVLKCLAKEPERRYATPAALAADIGRYLQHLPVSATGPGLLYRARKFARRRRRELIFAALAGFAAAALATSIALVSSGGGGEPAVSVLPLTSYEGSEMLPSYSPDNRVAFVWQGESGDNWDIYVVAGPGQPPRRMTFDPAIDSSPAWSPDGKRIAFARSTAGRNLILMLDVESGRESVFRPLRSGFAMNNRVVDWSPDGRWLAVVDHPAGGWENGIHLISLATGEDRTLTAPPKGVEDVQPAWSRDGRFIAFTRDFGPGREARVLIQKLTPDRRAQGAPVPIPGPGHFPVWSPAGDLIFPAFEGTTSKLWRFHPGAARAVKITAAGDRASTAAVSHDGRKVVFERNVGHTAILRFEVQADGSLSGPVPFAESTLSSRSPEFSPDGARVAFESDRSGGAQIWLANSSGGGLHQLTFGLPARLPVWSADGARIRYIVRGPNTGDQVLQVDAAGGQPALLGVPFPDSWYWSSADGRWLYGNHTGTGLIRIPADGSGPPVELRSGGANWERLSADGQWIYFTVRAMEPGPLRRIRTDGSGEAQVLAASDPASFLPVRDGVYFTLTLPTRRRSSLFFLRDGPAEPRLLAEIPHPVIGTMSLSPDGRTLLMGVVDQQGIDLMLAEWSASGRR